MAVLASPESRSESRKSGAERKEACAPPRPSKLEMI
jgi:hypothetical protein